MTEEGKDVDAGIALRLGLQPVCRQFHAGQELVPSRGDIDTMNKITQALKYVGMRGLDHVIRQDYFSFARAGMVQVAAEVTPLHCSDCPGGPP
ncbi:MAG: JAB domain-containing protein [Candidatus Cryosericum sp.]